jgi:hypothetical protein
LNDPEPLMVDFVVWVRLTVMWGALLINLAVCYTSEDESRATFSFNWLRSVWGMKVLLILLDFVGCSSQRDGVYNDLCWACQILSYYTMFGSNFFSFAFTTMILYVGVVVAQVCSSQTKVSTYIYFYYWQIPSGRYRILVGELSVRSFPGGAQQGPFVSYISLSDEFASICKQVQFFFVFYVHCWGLINSVSG